MIRAYWIVLVAPSESAKGLDLYFFLVFSSMDVVGGSVKGPRLAPGYKK